MNTRYFICNNINYVTDDIIVENLPQTLTFAVEDYNFNPDDDLADLISNETSYLVDSFNYIETDMNGHPFITKH